MNFLKGYRTYIVVAVAVIYNGLVGAGVIQDSYRDVINAILGFLGLGTMRAAVK